MPFSVALNQPRFADDDNGLNGDWTDVFSSLVDAGSSYLNTKTAATAATDRIQLQMQQQLQTAQVAAVTPITASPLFLPVVAGAAVLLFVMMKRGKM